MQTESGVLAKCKAEDQGKTTLRLSAQEHLLAKSLLADLGNNFFTAFAAAVLRRAWTINPMKEKKMLVTLARSNTTKSMLGQTYLEIILEEKKLKQISSEIQINLCID